MNEEDKLNINDLFGGLKDYNKYVKEVEFYKIFGLQSQNINIDPAIKVEHGIYDSVNPNNQVPFECELDDLTRLHFLLRSRKVTTVLEFGVGKSTPVLWHALKMNKKEDRNFVKNNLRRSNPYELHSVDNNEHWINTTKESFGGNIEGINFHLCDCVVGNFNGRLCTYYNNLPNICPDFIYLDAPDQFSAIGDLRGLSTDHPDRMPMAADILSIEHFLCPGTLIVVDGRTANARFLRANFQRNWGYAYSSLFDQHYFELQELPLGKLNEKHIINCHGENWLEKICNSN